MNALHTCARLPILRAIGLGLWVAILLPANLRAQKTDDICVLFHQAVMADPAEPEHYLLLNRCLVEGLNEASIANHLANWADERSRGRHGVQDAFFFAEQPRIYTRLMKQYPAEMVVQVALGRYYIEAEMWLNRQPVVTGAPQDYPLLQGDAQNYEPILPLSHSGALIRAEQLLREALRREPTYAPALAYMAHIFFHKARLANFLYADGQGPEAAEMLKIQHELYRKGIAYAETALRYNPELIHAEPLITQGLGNWHVTFYEHLEHAYVAERKIARLLLSDAIAALAETDAARRVARVMGVIRHARDLKMAAHFYWELAVDDHAFLTVYPPLQRVDIAAALASTNDLPAADPETYITRGLIAQWNGHYMYAAEEYAKAYELDPNNFRARYLQGLMYEAAGFLSRAVPIYQEVQRSQDPEAADVAAYAKTRLQQFLNFGDQDFLENFAEVREGQTVAVLGPNDHLLGLWASHLAPEVSVYVGLESFVDDFSGNAYLAPNENITRRIQDVHADANNVELPVSVDLIIINAEGLDAGRMSTLLAVVPRRLKPNGTVVILSADPETMGEAVLTEMGVQAGLSQVGAAGELVYHRAMWHSGHFLSRVATQTDCQSFNYAPTPAAELYQVPVITVYTFAPNGN